MSFSPAIGPTCFCLAEHKLLQCLPPHCLCVDGQMSYRDGSWNATSLPAAGTPRGDPGPRVLPSLPSSFSPPLLFCFLDAAATNSGRLLTAGLRSQSSCGGGVTLPSTWDGSGSQAATGDSPAFLSLLPAAGQHQGFPACSPRRVR